MTTRQVFLKQGGVAKLVRTTKLIIWVEASLARRLLIEAFNEMLQDVNDCMLPFGGKVVVVFGGDIRQVLPAVPKATRGEAINASLTKSSLWPILEKIELTEDMRAKSDTDFLIRIEEGTEKPIFNEKISIPKQMLISQSDDVDSLDLLVQHVFPDLYAYAHNSDDMTNRAILTPTNDCVDDINNLIISNFPGQHTEYKSFDKTLEPSHQGQYEVFITTLTPKGLPPHISVLKPNCPIILLKNIDPPEGLSNGTRLICCEFTPNMIYAEIVVGSYRGKKVFLSRIPLQPNEDEKFPVPFERKQFPVRLCCAMTINKAQGQTLEYVGLYLARPVFSHGQLYVAQSRARSSNMIKILVKPTREMTNPTRIVQAMSFTESYYLQLKAK